MPHTLRAGSTRELDGASQDEIRAAVGRILESRDFTASERRRAFLRFVVEEALAGRAQGLKGAVIAQEVYGRDADFSGKVDPVVRLDAGRLRRDLDSYYVGPGASDPIRISIPKGGYVPLFERQDDGLPAQTPEPRPASARSHTEPAGPTHATPDPGADGGHPKRRILAAIGAAVALAAILVVSWLLQPETPADPLAARGYPRVAIMPFTAVDSSVETRALAAGLGTELGHFLRHFEGLRIYEPFDGSDPGAVAARLSSEPGAVYAVGGQLQTEGARVRVDANLRDLRTGEVVWSDTYDVALAPDALMDLRDAVAGKIATALGQPYGPIGDDLARRSAGVESTNVESYLCVQRSFEHRRNFSLATYGPTLACLEAAVARDPDYSDAWAMLGWMHLDAGRYGFPGAAPMETEYGLALDAVLRSRALAPDSEIALRALASIQHYRGRYDESESLARRAVDLNPYDPDALAELGWRLAARGKFDEGVPLLHEAIDRSVDPPGWYFHLLAIDHLMKGDYAAMRVEAQRAALSGRPIAQALLAIAAGGLGDRETAGAALSRIPPAWDAEAYFRRHGATEDLVAALLGGLETARRLVERPTGP